MNAKIARAYDERQSQQTFDDASVDAFARAMKAKLDRKRAKFQQHEWTRLSLDELWQMLREHVEKGDPVDLGNIAMFIHQNGQRQETQ